MQDALFRNMLQSINQSNQIHIPINQKDKGLSYMSTYDQVLLRFFDYRLIIQMLFSFMLENILGIIKFQNLYIYFSFY